MYMKRTRKKNFPHLSQPQACLSRFMLTTLNKRHRMAGTFLLLFLGPSLIAGVITTPSCSDGMWEVLADQETSFDCTAEGEIQWRLQLNNTYTIILATCTNRCTVQNTFERLFKAITPDIHKTTMVINPVSNRKLYDNVQLLNGSLECSHGDDYDKFAGCGLNFVYPPSDVTCTASNSSWSINVSCVIGSVYSSRKFYTCSLIRTKMSENKTLQNVTMVTSPTDKRITKSEVKRSGSCHFSTRLPPQEGHYGFLVSVLPGRRTFMTEHKQFTVEKPRSPTISCSPQPHVLENTLVNCNCNTTSLGQPAGYLRWVTGNQTKQGTAVRQEKQELTSKGLHYSQVLTLSDHNNTWFRCDIIWGPKETGGGNYTASVGYAPKTPRLFFNKLERNYTVMERHQVNFMCESDGRPTPNVSIYNNDNDTVITRNSSPVIYTFIARCEDTATYTCSAWNEFSNQLGVTTSYSLKMFVSCKPRSLSSTHLGMIKFRNKRQDLSFDVIGYPVPLNCEIWFDPPEINNSKPFSRKFEGSELNVTCKASSKYLYLSRCTLTILSVPFQSDGLYILQVINEHGKENFTVEISYADDEDWKFFKLAMAGGVGSLVVVTFTILVLIVVMRKLTRSKGDQPSQAPEDIYENPLDGVPLPMRPLETDFTAGTSEPSPCQMPLYAVVDKTRKKTNTRPEVADDMKEARRNGPQDVNVSNSGLQCDTDDDYANLDILRGKTPAKRDKDYNYIHMKQESSSNIKKDFVATEVDLKIYDHLARPLLPPQQDKTSRSDVHVKGRKAEGLMMAI